MKDGIKTVTVILGILSFFSAGVLVLALSDIHSEYISAKALRALSSVAVDIPSWAHCQMEWIVVVFAVLLILAFHISLIVYFIRGAAAKRKESRAS